MSKKISIISQELQERAEEYKSPLAQAKRQLQKKRRFWRFVFWGVFGLIFVGVICTLYVR